MTQDWQKKEHSNTYWVQDRSNEEELLRLQQQGRMVTMGMGGVLAEQPHPIQMERVLDIGCGTGEWLIEAAKTYPSISLLIGIDVSKLMTDYARTQAEKQGVANRVEFRVMDVLRSIEFPDDFFDLVNQRLAVSYLRTWDWPNLLNEYRRVTRPGGVIRVTEGDGSVSNSPALTNLNTLMVQALSRSGHLFIPDDSLGVVNELGPLLERSGLKNVQKHIYKLESRAGTPAGQSLSQDFARLFRVLLPFFRQWIRVPDDYEEIYQRAMQEMQEPDFVTTWTLHTVWGIHDENR